MPDTIEIKLRNADNKIDSLISGQSNKLSVQTKMEATVIEMEDINFHFDSAVLLPDYGTKGPEDNTAEQNRLTGLGVLFSCYKQAEEKDFAQRILVTGHTDKKGGDFYNLTLSQKRAENVFFMFMGERTRWTDSSNEKHQVEDIQQILKWISFNFRYDCDPGEKTNKMNVETSNALLSFQKRYNEDFVVLEKHKEKFSRLFTKIDEDGKIGKQTWGAFFDMYALELLIVMGITEDGLDEIRSKLEFVKKTHNHHAPVVGCGENFPESGATTEEANAIDRRVEIIFFDEGEEPELKCHPVKFNCIKSKCDLYPKDKLYTHSRVPATPLPLPSGIAVRVHLKFMYKTPDGKERPFPKGFPYKFRFKDNSVEEFNIAKDDGQVFHQVLRDKKSFIIEFEFKEIHYVASPKVASPKDELVKESEVQEKIKNKFNVFNLPLKLSLKNSVWTLSPSVSNFDDTEKEFNDLENLSVENIGSEAAPINMILDPKWKHYKFTYYDRFLKKRLSILPLVVEGLNKKTDSNPVSKSHWFMKAEECLCVHWIDQSSPVPDKNSLVRFRTQPNTFIESSGTADNFSRKYVTKNSTTTATNEIGLNSGSPVNIDFDIMNAERMKYYDMPSVWKSQTYFTQQSPESGSGENEKDLFETFAEKDTTASRPLLFSLDDIVLYTTDSAGKISTPFNWSGSPIAVFCNTFTDIDSSGVQDTSNLTKFGLYKPITNTDYYSNKDIAAKRKDKLLQIIEYPDWIRLVAIKGNLFDAFNIRTPDNNTNVVGARAAVRWLDASSIISPGTDATSRPDITKRSSTFTIQPYYKQQHEFHGRIGRFDMVLLRCCDIENDTEIAVNLHYIRFHLAFNFLLSEAETKRNRVASTLSGTQAQNYINDKCNSIMNRWNGNDTINLNRSKLIPKDPKFGKLSIQTLWLIQAVPDSDQNLSHFNLKVFNDNAGRPFMTAKGTGELNETYTAADAHEAGHGNSLVDEYVERWSSASYRQPAFYSFSPGAPFDFDSRAMMNGNSQIRARYFWHSAEWLNKIYKSEFVIQRSIHKFNLPTHSEKTDKTFVSYPISKGEDLKSGERGRFDLYLYRLGEDEFSFDVLRTHPKNGKAVLPPFDSILIIIVKMKFDFHTDDHTTIKNGLANISTGIRNQFNQKFFASSVQLKLERCLLHFFPRFLVKNFSDDNEIKSDMSVSNKSEYDNKVSWIQSNYKLLFEVETKASGSSKWTESWFDKIIGNTNDLRILLDSNVATRFPRYFAHMVGIPDKKEEETSSYEPIAKKLILDAKIFKVFP